jgi:hypothetical protein
MNENVIELGAGRLISCSEISLNNTATPTKEKGK